MVQMACQQVNLEVGGNDYIFHILVCVAVLNAFVTSYRIISNIGTAPIKVPPRAYPIFFLFQLNAPLGTGINFRCICQSRPTQGNEVCSFSLIF